MRTVDYSVSDIGPVVYLDGNDNYKVLDNDLLGTSTLIGTGSNQPGASFLGGAIGPDGPLLGPRPGQQKEWNPQVDDKATGPGGLGPAIRDAHADR